METRSEDSASCSIPRASITCDGIAERAEHAAPCETAKPSTSKAAISHAARVSGKSACNRYSAGIEEGDNPGDILIGPTMGTRMACTDYLMEIESLYLKALAQVTSFSFYSGSLALNGQDEDGKLFSLLFKPTGKELK